MHIRFHRGQSHRRNFSVFTEVLQPYPPHSAARAGEGEVAAVGAEGTGHNFPPHWTQGWEVAEHPHARHVQLWGRDLHLGMMHIIR